MNILFLNAGRRCELIDAFRKALPHVGGGLIFASDISEFSPALRKADQTVIFPHSSAKNFLDILSIYCNENNIELLIPTIDPDLIHLDKLRIALKMRCPQLRLLISPTFTIKTASDKLLSSKHFKKIGADIPKTFQSNNAENFPYPVFIKPSCGSSAIGAQKIQNSAELANALKNVQSPIIEEFIEGPEYTVDVLCNFQGNPLIAIPRKRLKVRAGEVSQGIIERNPKLETLAKNFAKGFQATGPVTIQFISPKKDQFKAIEINARLGGGLPLTIAAGAHWPLWILQMCANRSPKIQTNIQNKLVMSRYDSSVYIKDKKISTHAITKKIQFRNIKGVIFDLDDTLYPEKDFIFSGYHTVAIQVAKDYQIEIECALKERFNKGERGDLFSAELAKNSIFPGENYIQSLVKIYREHHPNITPYADHSILKKLSEKKYKIGIITDGWEHVQRNKCQSLHFNKQFSSITLSDSLGGKDTWKPSKLPYLSCLKEMKISANQAIYIGDNPSKDFITAKKLGLKTIRIKRQGSEHEKDAAPTKFHQADCEISSLFELEKIIGF